MNHIMWKSFRENQGGDITLDEVECSERVKNVPDRNSPGGGR